MRVLKIGASVVVVSLVFSCGWFKKKQEDDEASSADAIAEDSEIQWDTVYHLNGELVEDSTRTGTEKFTFTTDKVLILATETNMRLIPAAETVKCPAGSRFSGAFFTLTSADGLFIRTTDSIDRIATPSPIDAFPGRVPAGTYTLTAKAYGTGDCLVDVPFSFPNPHAGQDFPDDADTALDANLLGTWSTDALLFQGVRTSLTLTFDRSHGAAVTMRRGDVVSLDSRAKYRLDMQSVPRRLIMTVTTASTNVADRRIGADAELRCIYYASPVSASTSLLWECQDLGLPGFPVDFGDEADELFRDASGPDGVYDFEVFKGGNVSLPIPDDDSIGTAYTFEFSAESSRVVDLGITFTANHAHPADLRVTLVHPDGTEVPLFDQETVTGTYLTKNFGLGGSRFEALDAFKGKDLNGKWKLLVSDETAGDTGALTVAKLTLRGAF